MSVQNLEIEAPIGFSEMKAGLRESALAISNRRFEANETTRISNRYFLPTLKEGWLPWHETDYLDVLNRRVKSDLPTTVLDLGCGAGFWMEETRSISPLIEVFGVTAKDYRRAKHRPIVHKDETSLVLTKGLTIFYDDVGVIYDSDVDLLHDAQIDDDHYLIGDVYKTIKKIPPGSFDLIVSNQACKYFFDPLRALKHIHRILKPNGYAFLESMCPLIYPDYNCEPLSDDQVERLFSHAGLKCNYQEYSPNGLNIRRGLAFKKIKPRLNLPVTYRDIDHNPGTKTDFLTYSLV